MTARTVPLPHPAVRVTRSMLRAMRPALLGYFAIMMLIVAVLIVGVATLGEIRFSGWSAVTSAAFKYWLLAIGILLTAVQLRFYVSNGITRRHFWLGGSGYMLAVTAMFVVVGLIGYAIERPIYDAAGWLTRLDDPYPINSMSDAGMHVGRAFALYLAHFVAGWLIGTGYYRFGPWLGTLLILPFFGLAALTEYLFGTEWVPAFVNGPVPYGAAVVISLALTAAGLFLVRSLLVTVAVNRPAG
jgi:hypothetical protein